MAIDAQANIFKIVIVGGGIGGLAAVGHIVQDDTLLCITNSAQAVALRGPQREIVILEKSRMQREVGALLSLQPNSQKIVSRWNIDSFLAPGKPMDDKEFRIMDTTGQIRMRMPLEKEKYGANRVCYHRQDLHAGLKAAATSDSLPGPPAKVVTASKVTSCDCEAGVVTLEDGTTYEGDLIIGADGIHSVIRDAVLKGITPEPAQPKPTGISAYRLLLNTADLPPLPVSAEVFDHQRACTTLMMGYDKRVIMGPARGGEVLGMVCIVPDENMNEDSSNNSWTTPGSLDKLLETYSEFPEWIRELFKHAPDIALWQLRDIDTLPTWTKGRTILIGDAAHAMLPTQGQGAGQSVEDAEALQAFFADIKSKPSATEVHERLSEVFEARYERASLIQAYSRQQAANATDKGSTTIKLNPAEFMDYNCNYDGALEWVRMHGQKGRLLE